MIIWLVVWNMNGYHFSHHIGNFIIPTDELIFSQGMKPTTNQSSIHGIFQNHNHQFEVLRNSVGIPCRNFPWDNLNVSLVDSQMVYFVHVFFSMIDMKWMDMIG
jgi:hypothetical protein